MKIKDLIELLEEENPKAKIIFEYDNIEIELNEWNIESSNDIVNIVFTEK